MYVFLTFFMAGPPGRGVRLYMDHADPHAGYMDHTDPHATATYSPTAPWPRADAHIHLVPPDGGGSSGGSCSWAAARTAEGTVYNEPLSKPPSQSAVACDVQLDF